MEIRTALICAMSVTALFAGVPLTPAAAQVPGTSSSGCEATPAQAPTPTAHGAHSGTQPGGSGSTAWSGGTGGSNIGTTPGAPTPGSPTDHPPTVQGVSPSVVGPVRRDC